MTNTTSADVLIVGGGIVGLTAALEARRRFPGASVTVIEKESACGRHASTRNSGVLHAGFYYAADSLKARLSVEGSRRMRAFCDEHGLRINRCGKLVVPTAPEQLATLDELASRGRVNGVEVEIVSAADARAIEPRVRPVERALYSPTTASVDPAEVMACLVTEAERAGVRIETATAYHGVTDRGVVTSRGPVAAGYVINAAGLHADRVARDFGFGERYAIVPFKGVYLYADPGTEPLRTHVYPVPDLANPFLGVHLTVTVDGRVKVGPSAIPALWRQQYGGLAHWNVGELLETARHLAGLWLRDDFGFRRLALREVKKYSRAHLAGLAADLVPDLRPEHFTRWGVPGIRAQLLDRSTRRLEMDFCVEHDQRSLHVLNAVSPAFTCAFAFAEHLLDMVEGAWAP